MQYRKLGKTGLKVSDLCLGAMNFGWTASEEESHTVLNHFVAASGDFSDTADVYAGGKSEETLGRWLKTQPRDQVIVATRCASAPSRTMSDSAGITSSLIRHIRVNRDPFRLLKNNHKDSEEKHHEPR